MEQPVAELYVHCQGGLTHEDLRWLKEKMALAVELVSTQWAKSLMGTLSEIEVSLIDDETIAQVHEEFMDDPTPTDVITFSHGEVLVSVETAARQGGEFGKDERGETLMYIVHGFMHLAGFDDLTPDDAAMMAREQEAVWQAVILSPQRDGLS